MSFCALVASLLLLLYVGRDTNHVIKSTRPSPSGNLVSRSQTFSRGEKESGPLTYNVLFSAPPGFGG